MTYFGFLALFLGIPIAILSVITIRDYRRGKWSPQPLNTWPAWIVMVLLGSVAMIWTTPWDNYLVATGVWWYDVDLVANIIIGWVPIEEYTFFVVQPVMTALFWLWLVRNLPINMEHADNVQIRKIATAISGMLWLVMTVILGLTFVSEAFAPATYLGLELSWALIPITIQMAFGADILWRHRRIVFFSIAIPTLYLSAADAVAIGSGTWTIDPAQSLNIYLGGVLPIEEFIFFLLTNALVVLGMTLVLAEESQERAIAYQKYALLRPILRFLLNLNPHHKVVQEGA